MLFQRENMIFECFRSFLAIFIQIWVPHSPSIKANTFLVITYRTRWVHSASTFVDDIKTLFQILQTRFTFTLSLLDRFFYPLSFLPGISFKAIELFKNLSGSFCHQQCNLMLLLEWKLRVVGVVLTHLLQVYYCFVQGCCVVVYAVD